MGWLAVSSWPALLPFIVGGVLAYIVMPLVDDSIGSCRAFWRRSWGLDRPIRVRGDPLGQLCLPD